MIKIIYGVNERISSDCELIFPDRDTIGLIHLVQHSVIKNDVDEATVGMHFYSVHCPGDFFVFSKVNIVRDKNKRVSHCAFMLAFESKEKDYSGDILSDIQRMEQQYNDNQLTQSHSIPTGIKIGKDTGRKQTVAVYYDDEDELKEYFKINLNYKPYEAVFFINKHYENRPENPLHALRKYDKIIEIRQLNQSSEKREDEIQKKSEQKIGKESSKPIVTHPIAGALFGFYSLITRQYETLKSACKNRISNKKS